MIIEHSIKLRTVIDEAKAPSDMRARLNALPLEVLENMCVEAFNQALIDMDVFKKLNENNSYAVVERVL